MANRYLNNPELFVTIENIGFAFASSTRIKYNLIHPSLLSFWNGIYCIEPTASDWEAGNIFNTAPSDASVLYPKRIFQKMESKVVLCGDNTLSMCKGVKVTIIYDDSL